MSLIHWWPLNGNLNDYGTKGANAGSGGVVDNSGKIGKCYKCFSSNRLNLPYTIDTPTDVFTIAMWIKIPTAMSSNTDWQTVWSYNCIDNGSAGSKSASWAGYHNLKIYSTSNHQYWWLAPGTNFNYDEWFHVVLVHTGNNTQTTVCYVNGSSIGKQTSSASLNISSGTFVLGNNVPEIYFNDVRIYDHALSVKEVRELAKGLVLHYTFEDEYIEATTNLSNANWSAYNSYFTIQSQTANEITLVSQGTTHGVVALQNSSVKSQLTANTTITISGYLYKDGTPYKTTVTMPTSYNSWTNISRESRDDGYFRLTGKFGNLDSGWLFHVALFGYPASGIVCKIKNLQWEIKDHATPYVNGTRSNGLIYDNSGYGYNGTPTGAIQILENSPSGQHCINFPANSCYVKLPAFNMGGFANSYTFCWWSKITDMSGRMAWGFSDGNRLNLYPSGAFCWNTGDGGSNKFQNNGTAVSFTPYNNAWHFYTITGDGTTTKLYIDGQYVGSATTYKALTGTQIYISGWDTGTSYKWTGQIADFKMYATALSASDILAEYQRKAAIDRNGNLYSGQFIEQNGTTKIATKKGQVITDNFVEGTDKVKVFDKYTELEYIESTGTQYINTSVSISDDFEFILEQMSNLDTGNHYLCGSSSSGRMLGTLNNRLWSNAVVASGIAVGKEVRQTVGCHIIANGSNGSDYVMSNYTLGTSQSGHSSYSTSSSSNTVCVFKVNGGSQLESFKCYNLKVFSLGVLVLHLIPAKRKSDNVIGLFDLVNQKFYTNAGTGTFTAGPEKGELSIVCTNELNEL